MALVVKRAVAAIVLVAMMAGLGHAETVSLPRALALAQTNHPAVLGRRSEQTAAQAEKEGAEWARYPTPVVEATSRGSGDADRIGVLRIDQPIWAGGRITAGIEIASRRLDAAGASVDEIRLELSQRVINAYLDALRQKARSEHARAGVGEHEKLLAMIGRRVQQEVSSPTDQRLAESRLYQAKSEYSLIEQGLKQALTQLSQLSGRPVTDVSWQGIEERDLPASLDSALNAALGAAPSLRRLRFEEDAAVADIDLKRSAYMPQLAFRLERSAGGGVAPDNRAMVVLTAQPGSGLAAVSGVEAAIARRDAVRQSREAAERDVRERVGLDWDEWLAAKARAETAGRSSEMSSEVFDSYARQYVIGRKTWLDVLNAVREAIQSRYTLEDATAQSMAAGLRLRAQTGTLKIE